MPYAVCRGWDLDPEDHSRSIPRYPHTLDSRHPALALVADHRPHRPQIQGAGGATRGPGSG